MKSLFREPSYIMVSFGLINLEAQSKATIGATDNMFNYYTDYSKIFEEQTDSIVYATLEDGFTKVDGSMFFPPREDSGDSIYPTGITSMYLVSEATTDFVVNLNTDPIDFKGLTINFGDNYPVEFDVVSDSGALIQVTDNDKSVWYSDEVLEDTTSLTITAFQMKNEHSRLRVYSISFGYGLTYYNDSVITSTMESYISPIGADVPQVDFSVELKNYDKYFNVDNPNSAINFLETGQQMTVYYGYHLPISDNVEWVKGNTLLCSEWESDDNSATIRGVDVFRNMDSEYYKGVYSKTGVSYYDLAEQILKDANVDNYYIDPRLKSLYSKCPIPRVTHKEALQIIANASRCVLSQTRDGGIQIKSAFVPELTISDNGHMFYSNIQDVLNNDSKDEVMSLGTNYAIVDGSMKFQATNATTSTLHTGFVSTYTSDSKGVFATTKPTITITQEAACSYKGLKIKFGNTLPSQITITTYNNEVLVETLVIDDGFKRDMIILHNFDDFDKMEVVFDSTQNSRNKIVVQSIAMGDVTDFTMERLDMLTSPKAIKQELVKDITVPCYSYDESSEEENLVREDVTVASGDVETYYMGDASYNYRVTLDDATSSNVEIVSTGSFYVTIRYKNSGTFTLRIYGYKYKISERLYTKTLNARGKSIKWENPIVSSPTVATDLMEWLADYYSSNIEYEYDTRGNPELDVNDIIYQENEFVDNMKVSVYRHTVTFAQGLSGKVTARRIGGGSDGLDNT